MAEQEIKELKGKIENLVSTIQTEQEARKDEKSAFDETVSKMAEEASKAAEELQRLNDSLEAEVKAREQLELTIAMLGEQKDGEKSLSDTEYKKAFYAKLRQQGDITREGIENEIQKMIDYYVPHATDDQRMLIGKTLLVGSSPDTGYFVPVDATVRISERIFETSPMNQLATVFTTANNSVVIAIDDQEAGSAKRSEVAPVVETSTPQVGELEINTHEYFAEPKASQRLLDDSSIDLETWLNNKIASKLARDQNADYVNGDGNGGARGFTVLPAWANPGVYERGKLENISGLVATKIEGDDLINMQAALLEEYQAGAVFAGHRLTWAEIVKLKDSTGQYLINPQLLFTGTTMQLLGVPFRFFGDMAKPVAGVYTAGQLPVAYANFSEGYTIVNRMGIRIIRDNITEKGFVKWYTMVRSGGDVTNYQAIKRLEIT